MYYFRTQTGVTIQKNGFNKKKVFQGMLSIFYVSITSDRGRVFFYALPNISPLSTDIRLLFKTEIDFPFGLEDNIKVQIQGNSFSLCTEG